MGRLGVDQLLAGGVGHDRAGLRVDLVPDGALDVRALGGAQSIPVGRHRLTVPGDRRVELAGLGADALFDDQLAPTRVLEGDDIAVVLHLAGVCLELAVATLAGVDDLLLALGGLAGVLRSSHGSLLSLVVRPPLVANMNRYNIDNSLRDADRYIITQKLI